MKDVKLTKRKPFANFGLIFWNDYDGVSEDLSFTNEIECDKILAETVEGKGISVSYDYPSDSPPQIVYPRRIIKVVFAEEFAGEFKEAIGKDRIGKSNNPPHLSEGEEE